MPILIPSPGPNSWREFLAQPEVHWETGFSARTLAYAWEDADGLPPEIADILKQAFGPIELLVAIPEHKTPLPGGRRASQADVFMLVRHSSGLIACTIEGKVEEPFGPTVDQFSLEMSDGKRERLAHLCQLLGLSSCPGDVHYQLLHRTASALIEAERFCAQDAAMIVHSFSPERQWFEAFNRFCMLLGCNPTAGTPAIITVPSGKRLALAWACGDQRFRSM